MYAWDWNTECSALLQFLVSRFLSEIILIYWRNITLSTLQTFVLLNIFVETVIYLFQGFFGEVKQNLFEIEFETT